MIKENLAKYIGLFDKPDRRYFLIILLLAFVVVILETLSIGLIIPALHILSSFDSNENTLKVFSFIGLEDYSREKLFIISVSTLLLAYTVKALFLTFASYKEHDYLTRVKLNLSKKLFSIYLTKPYTFHLKTNSSKLIRNLLDLKRFSAVMTSGSNIITMQQLDNGDKTLFLDINNSNNTVDITQSGTGEHFLDLKLDTGNYAHDVDITQQGSGNHAGRVELDGYSTDFDLTQQGSTDQDYNINMTCGTVSGCTLSTTQGN